MSEQSSPGLWSSPNPKLLVIIFYLTIMWSWRAHSSGQALRGFKTRTIAHTQNFSCLPSRGHWRYPPPFSPGAVPMPFSDLTEAHGMTQQGHLRCRAPPQGLIPVPGSVPDTHAASPQKADWMSEWFPFFFLQTALEVLSHESREGSELWGGRKKVHSAWRTRDPVS